MEKQKIKVWAITGPTASGKSALALSLAKAVGGEILSCDSMQVYRKMNIGTAKPTEEEQQAVKHRLIDLVEPTEPFSCADYARFAADAVRETAEEGKMPIFCGGTGLYLDSAIRPARHAAPGENAAIREKLSEFCAENGEAALHNRLREVDPASADSIHPNNVKRVIRALEIYEATGKSKTEWDEESRKSEYLYEVCPLSLAYRDREKLNGRIDRRVDEMFSAGLVREVEEILSDGGFGETASQAIGYKELIAFFRGECSENEAKEAIKLNTRRYAKRQVTWFSAKNYPVLYLDEIASVSELTEKALGFLQKPSRIND